ncbi:hypothetical protein L2E82_46633 [Cichorium intybus]|uniref:Uncharacterized protein n=1 Tax=Cichorium intybus TaxID=13427 RepID=A0ACB8YSU4_CICIN|nr:hypothetical protein L2E82_46633 [Cichorium intybus]
MFGEQEATIPSFFYPTSSPNPNSPHANASMYQYSLGLDGLAGQPAFELDRDATSRSGMIPQTTDSSTYKHCVTTQNMVNDVIVTTSQPESIQSLQCELASTNVAFNATSEAGTAAQTNPDPLRCELCKICCTSTVDLNIHMSGKKHLKKVDESGKIPDPPLTLVASQDTQPTKPMQNPESIEGKAVNSHEGNPVLCELCGISCDTYDVLKAHLSGKKHQKKLEKSEKPIGPNPAPATVPGMLENEAKEEGKIVNVDGSNRKTKRVESNEDLEAKRQKILQGGAAMDALRTCTVCNVICSSPTVYISHLAGRKHVAMVIKQAETQLTGQET